MSYYVFFLGLYFSMETKLKTTNLYPGLDIIEIHTYILPYSEYPSPPPKPYKE